MPARTIKELLSLQPPAIQEIIKPRLLTRGGSFLIYGDPETFKSWLTIDMAFALTAGSKWLFYDTTKSKVLLLQSEQDEFDYRDRFLAYTQSANGRVTSEVLENLYAYTDRDSKMDNFYGQSIITPEIERIKPNVIIIDNLTFSISGSEKDELNIKKLLDYVRHYQQKYHCSIVLVHHTRKERGDDSSDKGMQEASGTYVLSRWADTIIRVYLVDPAQDIIQINFQKQKNARQRMVNIRVKFDRAAVKFITV